MPTYEVSEHLDTRKTQAKIQRINDRARAKGITSNLTCRFETVEEIANGKVTRTHLLVIEGDSPRIAGWAYTATVEHVDADNIILTRSPWSSTELDRSTLLVPRCDHCKRSHRRKWTLVLTHTDGRQAQVGKACAKDYLGADISPVWLGNLGIEAEGPSGPRWPSALTVDYFLSVVAAHARVRGYDKEVTPHNAWEQGLGIGKGPREAVTTEDEATAAAVLAWLEQQQASNWESDYFANATTVIKHGIVEPRRRNLIASLVGAYLRQHQEAAVAAQYSTSMFAPEKAKIMTPGEVLTVRRFEKSYRGNRVVSELLIIRAGDHLLKWWASRAQWLQEGQQVMVQGTVKGSDSHNGKFYTVLTRCTVTKEGEAA